MENKEYKVKGFRILAHLGVYTKNKSQYLRNNFINFNIEKLNIDVRKELHSKFNVKSKEFKDSQCVVSNNKEELPSDIKNNIMNFIYNQNDSIITLDNFSELIFKNFGITIMYSNLLSKIKGLDGLVVDVTEDGITNKVILLKQLQLNDSPRNLYTAAYLTYQTLCDLSLDFQNIGNMYVNKIEMSSNIFAGSILLNPQIISNICKCDIDEIKERCKNIIKLKELIIHIYTNSQSSLKSILLCLIKNNLLIGTESQYRFVLDEIQDSLKKNNIACNVSKEFVIVDYNTLYGSNT